MCISEINGIFMKKLDEVRQKNKRMKKKNAFFDFLGGFWTKLAGMPNYDCPIPFDLTTLKKIRFFEEEDKENTITLAFNTPKNGNPE
jgi:hypothetical protein